MTVTSAQVARAAGVSRATVSYVLNDVSGQKISPATRETVLRAARELGYRPNASARNLRTGRGTAVLFPLPGMQHTHVVTRLVEACSTALTAAGWSLVTDFTVYPDVESQLDAWSRTAPAAVLDLFLRHDDPVLPELRRSGVVVLSAALPSDSQWESTSDAFALAVRETQVGYLVDSGARDLSLVLPARLPTDPRVERSMVRRLRTSAERRGAAVTVDRCALTSDALTGLVRRWQERGCPDAVAAYNDDYALALLTALTASGFAVPRDVRLIGVDDIPLSSVVTPPLTTITASFDEYAVGLAQTVDQALVRPGRAPDVVRLPVPEHQLVVRSSA